jgi:hypothetical protein
MATPAAAATGSEYPSDAARSFNGGAAGWNASSSFDGTCVPPLVCPTVTNSYVGGGDAEGNGFISSDYLGVAGVDGVGGTATGVWTSPPFAYDGNGGGVPATVGFSISRRADVAQLLAVAGSSATYSARLLDLSEGNAAMTLIAPTSLAGAEAWTPATAAIKASRLTVGHRYGIQVLTAYSTGTSVLVTASADYDNVVLRAIGSAGNGSGNGKGDGGGRDSLRTSELIAMFGPAQPRTAAVAGRAKRLLVRVRCPKRIGRSCRVVAQGLLSRRRPATGRRAAKIGKGRTRLVALRVKPRLRTKVARRKGLLVRIKVRAGGAKATVVKTRKLIRR